MTRWAPGAAQRLHDAAMALFAEQGFAVTTVPQIAERAGLTTRSFFRWYPDKREVLFSGEDELPGVVARVFAEAPTGLEPLEVVRRGFAVVLNDRFEQLRPELLARWRIVRTDEGLLERHTRKLTILLDAAVRGFRDRGLDEPHADLAGRLAVTLYDAAVQRWLADDQRTFAQVSEEVFADFAGLLPSGTGSTGRPSDAAPARSDLAAARGDRTRTAP